MKTAKELCKIVGYLAIGAVLWSFIAFVVVFWLKAGL